MKMDLLKLSEEIITNREWGFLDREYQDKDERNHRKSIMEDVLSGELTPKEDMVRLYEEGVTCKELGEIFGRSFQSIARSVKNYGDDKTVQKHRENRKKWVRLMRRYNIVYLTDISGGYDRLMSTYGVDDAKAKVMYRNAGGKFLIQKARKEDETVDDKIAYLVGEGYTGIEIARILDMPQATVYYRINNRIKEKIGTGEQE